MIFNAHQLTGQLAAYIESIFHFEGFVPDHSIERVVPTGHVFLIFELDGIERQTFENSSLKPINTYTNAWISGIHKNHISISAHEDSEMFVIQFKSFGAYPFLQKSIHEFCDKIIGAENVFGEGVLELREALINARAATEKFAKAERWLNQLYSHTHNPPAEIVEAVEELHIHPTKTIKELVSGYSKTQKHLIAQFKKYVGVTPKYYQRIIRFNEILRQMHQSQSIDWAQIALQFDYTDQSHFIKEFKHFSGFNPEKFIKNDYHKDQQNFFPLD